MVDTRNGNQTSKVIAQNKPIWPHSILVVGCGLIGMSIAKAVVKVFDSTVVLDGVEVSSFYRQIAGKANLFRALHEQLPTDREYDLVVLAVPVDVACTYLEPAMHIGEYVMDVCSAKVKICEAALQLGLKGRFLPTHPMAGLAAAGPERASADIFVNRPWLGIDGWPVPESLIGLIHTIGAKWVTLSSDHIHDVIMGVVSHGVHLTSLATMLAYADAEAELGLELAALTGPAFRDVTRLASSPSGFWTSTLLSNSHATIKQLKRIVFELNSFIELLEHSDTTGLMQKLQRAQDERRQWEDNHFND